MKMKNKKQKDVDAKKKHLEELNVNKNRKRGVPDLTRTEATIPERKSFLIFSEGKNTEKSYFEQFKLPTVEVEVIGAGKVTYSLVEYAIPIAQQKNAEREKTGKTKFDEVWCVFDADPVLDAPKQLTNFKNAIDLANANGIKVAYSNQAFEYWFILHFEDHQGGTMHRDDYHDKINSYLKPLGCYYDGKNSKKVGADFFNQMLVIVDKTYDGKPITRQDKAIQRAKRILQYHNDNGTSPAKAESSTTVFELVERLKK
jgi:RloB-like protein